MWADASFDLLAMQHSQEHEHEADTLGINIMAQACFDPGNGVSVMKRLAMLEHGADLISLRRDLTDADEELVEGWINGQSRFGSLLASHPPCAQRVDNLRKMVPTLSEHYLHACGQTEKEKTAFQRAYV